MEVRPGYRKTDVGVIPNDWLVRSLQELGSFKNGINKQSDAFGHGFPFVNLMDVFGYTTITSNDAFGLVETTRGEREVYNLSKGDVLFIRSSVKPSGVGLTAVIEEDLPKTVYSGFIIRFRDSGTLRLGFKRYCFYGEDFRKRLINASSVSANTNINQNNLQRLLIPLPPTKAEQEAIAEALSDADAYIESLEKLIAKKRLIKQGAMQELLTGKRRLPGFSVKWKLYRADEIGQFRGGSGFPTRYQGLGSGEYPFFKVSDMNNIGNETFMMTSNNYISEESRRQIGAVVYPEDSIVFAKVGAAIFLERKKLLVKPSCLDNNMAAYILDANKANYLFIHYLLLNTKLGDLVNATALPSLNGSVLGSIELLLPPLDEQSEIANTITYMDAEIMALNGKLAKALQIKQGMMQELLTGRIRLV
jgi:type I restriction enzyme, S subunit